MKCVAGEARWLAQNDKLTMRKSYDFRTFRITEIAVSCQWKAIRAESRP